MLTHVVRPMALHASELGQQPFGVPLPWPHPSAALCVGKEQHYRAHRDLLHPEQQRMWCYVMSSTAYETVRQICFAYHGVHHEELIHSTSRGRVTDSTMLRCSWLCPHHGVRCTLLGVHLLRRRGPLLHARHQPP